MANFRSGRLTSILVIQTLAQPLQYVELPMPLAVAAKIVLNLTVVPGKIEGENTLLSLENQSPVQAGSAFIDSLSQFAYGNSRVRVRIPESIAHELQGGRHFVFASRCSHNTFEPDRQRNGNHSCPR